MRVPFDIDVTREDMRRVAIAGAAIFAIMGCYCFIAPNWYEAQLSLVPQMSSRGSAGAGLAAAASAALGGDVGLDLNFAPPSASDEKIQAVLKSRSVTDAVVRKFDLMTRYGEHRIEKTRTKLWKHCSARIDKRPSVVTLTCEDKDPAMAAAIAAYFGDVGNEVFRRISVSSAGEERRFLEKRVAEAHEDVEAASRRLREFQEKYKIVDLGEQSKAVVSALATMKADMLSKEIQLSYLNSFSSADESTAAQLRRQLAVMQSKMRALEEQSSGVAKTGTAAAALRSKPDGLFPAALDVPKLRFDLEQLYRDQKVQEALYLMLQQRYEMAKVNEARDTSAFLILDSPVVPTYHHRPDRPVLLAFGGATGLFLGLLWAFAARRRYRDAAAMT